MTGCIDPGRPWELLVQADHDGELAAVDAAAVATHVAACPHCAAWQRDLAGLSASLQIDIPRQAASPALRRTMIARVAGRRGRPGMGVFAGFGAGAAVAAGLLLALLPAGPGPEEALVAAHVRALQPGHLTDVPSSDRHTVKPWFDGRLDFAPPVRDLAAAGFVLTGGRLDVLAARPVAALVYRRAKHDIDLFIWPGDAPVVPAAGTVRGYNFLSWTIGGMALHAVSDIEPAELRAFMQAWAQAPEDAAPPVPKSP